MERFLAPFLCPLQVDSMTTQSASRGPITGMLRCSSCKDRDCAATFEDQAARSSIRPKAESSEAYGGT